MNKQIVFFFKYATWVPKKVEFDADFESVKKQQKNSCKKVINEKVIEKLRVLLIVPFFAKF